MTQDDTKTYLDRVQQAVAQRRPLLIRGSNSKAFYGRRTDGEELDVSGYSGIISYDPTELVATVRAGTPLAEVEAALAEGNQSLPFEPPYFNGGGTIGGAVASGLSGPRRPYAGAVRDFILGVRCITGRGEDLRFGGQVMKNVAGYDVSRLLTGSMGTLGVILEVSLKVLPRPEAETTRVLEVSAEDGFAQVERWVGETLPISGASHDGRHLYVRLSGAASTVDLAAAQIGGEALGDESYWKRLRDHELDFFRSDDAPLWRVALPVAAGPLGLAGEEYQDWGGRLRWLRTRDNAEAVRSAASRLGGHATLFRGGDRSGEVFQPLAAPVMTLQRRIKQSLDPEGILNPGRMYSEI